MTTAVKLHLDDTHTYYFGVNVIDLKYDSTYLITLGFLDDALCKGGRVSHWDINSQVTS